MRLIIHPVSDRQREIDVTHHLVAAIAAELWRRYGGNDALNWVEAELHLGAIMEDVRREAREEALREVGEFGTTPVRLRVSKGATPQAEKAPRHRPAHEVPPNTRASWSKAPNMATVATEGRVSAA